MSACGVAAAMQRWSDHQYISLTPSEAQNSIKKICFPARETRTTDGYVTDSLGEKVYTHSWHIIYIRPLPVALRSIHKS